MTIEVTHAPNDSDQGSNVSPIKQKLDDAAERANAANVAAGKAAAKPKAPKAAAKPKAAAAKPSQRHRAIAAAKATEFEEALLSFLHRNESAIRDELTCKLSANVIAVVHHQRDEDGAEELDYMLRLKVTETVARDALDTQLEFDSRGQMSLL